MYFAAVAVGVLVALTVPGTGALEAVINPALAIMLFATFLQVPLAELRQALGDLRFLAASMAANFAVIPLVVGLLFQFVPDNPLIQLGVLLVLLTPCIDYVVTFAYLGRADARLLLAATPALLIVQMLLLPGYLHVFLGESATGLVRAGPFVHAFLWIIALPLVLAGLVQLGAMRVAAVRHAAGVLGVLPVPATALVLFIVVAAVVPRLGEATGAAVRVAPVYIAFAVVEWPRRGGPRPGTPWPGRPARRKVRRGRRHPRPSRRCRRGGRPTGPASRATPSPTPGAWGCCRRSARR